MSADGQPQEREFPRLMRLHERYRGKPFAELVVEEYRRLGTLELVAEEFEVSFRTLTRWIPRLGLKLEHRLVLVDPDAGEDDGAEPAPETMAAAR